MPVRALRCLDGIFFALAAQLVICLHPGLARDLAGNLLLVDIVPLVLIAFFVLRLPWRWPALAGWDQQGPLMRLYALGLAFLAPFIVWASRFPENPYLLMNGVLAWFAAVGLLYEFNSFLSDLGKLWRRSALETEARWNRVLTLVLLFVPSAILMITVAVDAAQNQRPPVYSFFAVMRQALGFIGDGGQKIILVLALIALLPVALTVSLLLRARFVAAELLEAGDHQAVRTAPGGLDDGPPADPEPPAGADSARDDAHAPEEGF